MRTWIKRTLLGVFGAAVALGGLTACGHRYGHERFSNLSAEEQAQLRNRAIDRVASRLELDADQKKRLNTLAEKLLAQRAALKGTTDTRSEMRSLVAGDKFDRARAQALLGEKITAVQAGSPEVIAAFGDFYDGLAPAQQAKVREFLQHRSHGGWRRG